MKGRIIHVNLCEHVAYSLAVLLPFLLQFGEQNTFPCDGVYALWMKTKNAIIKVQLRSKSELRQFNEITLFNALISMA